MVDCQERLAVRVEVEEIQYIDIWNRLVSLSIFVSDLGMLKNSSGLTSLSSRF